MSNENPQPIKVSVVGRASYGGCHVLIMCGSANYIASTVDFQLPAGLTEGDLVQAEGFLLSMTAEYGFAGPYSRRYFRLTAFEVLERGTPPEQPVVFIDRVWFIPF